MKKLFPLFAMLCVALMLSCEPVDQPNNSTGNGNNTDHPSSTPDQPTDTSLSAITFVPQDGSIAATVNGRGDASQTVINLEVTPKSAIAAISKIGEQQ